MAPITINGNVWDPSVYIPSSSSTSHPDASVSIAESHRDIRVAVDSPSHTQDAQVPRPTIAANAEDTNYILVQAKELLSNAEKQDLEILGVKFLSYVDKNTYLCGYEKSDLAVLRAKVFLEHVDVYHPFFKINPSLWTGSDRGGALMASTATTAKPECVKPLLVTMRLLLPSEGHAAASALPSNELDSVDVIIQIHEDVSLTQLVKELEDLNVLTPDTPASLGTNMVFTTINHHHLAELAAHDSIRAVSENQPESSSSNIALTLLNAPVFVPNVANTLGLTKIKCKGAGQIIHVADEGFDKGQTTGTDAEVHPAFTGRVLALYNVPVGSAKPVYSDVDSHGTHVAGCAVGDGPTTSMGGVAAKGPGTIRGTAPAAQLICTRRTDDNNIIQQVSFNELLDRPYTQGARISNHSYNQSPKATATGPLPYDLRSTAIDTYIFNKPDLLVCWSAGNDGEMHSPAHQIGDSAASKNVLTVGNSYNARQVNLTDDKFDRAVQWEADTYQMDGSSSRGPTMEQRIKPDVCAPGNTILSALTRSLASGTKTDDFGKSDDALYFFDSGTSMSTPLVAGCAAVLREALGYQGLSNPSAALLKALLINGAMDILGATNAPVTGNPQELQGFGRVNMGGTMHAVLDDRIDDKKTKTGGFFDVTGVKDPKKPMDVVGNGETQSFTLAVPKPKNMFLDQGGETSSSTLKVTMTWMDTPGKDLVDKLGLSVTAKGERRHGNKGSANMSATPKAYDDINNVQQVIWENVPEGDVHVAVECYHTVFAADKIRYAVAWSLE
ncbi:hypothetical protein N0V90_012681 [Kalmusia sp. IMI 367209]|nr:hypothetical protein N0V90_012681 [Kalmusia sp. IMI 367209]